MSIQLTVDVVLDPIDATAGLGSVSGRYTSSAGLSSVAVKWRDSAGNVVTATATLVAGTGPLDGPEVQTDGSITATGAWSASGVDVSTLVPGPVLVLVTATDVHGAKEFDAASTSVGLKKRFVTCVPWATHADVRALGKLYDPIPDAAIDEFCWMAGDILYLLTGSRWTGVCRTEKLRPQARWRQYDRPQWWQSANWMPTRSRAFSRYGWCSCNRGRDYGCSTIPEIMLPHGPWLSESIVVMIDGNQFDGWVLRDGVWLQRTDGNGWPCCQRTELPDTEQQTWSVSGSHGRAPDAGGANAAAILGHELALGSIDSDDAKLPDRVLHLTRAGTAVDFMSAITLFQGGFTGITEVDLWLASKSLGAKMKPATIHAIGKMPRFRHE